MRPGAITLLIFFAITSALAQTGNEWIRFSQPYFKIPVARDGIYRLNFTELQAAGIPSSIDPRNFQLYHRGIEQAMYVQGENDGQLNPSDYVEFYGIRNDGTLDTELYKTPASQPHTLYNLYNDTTSYFLTIGPSAGKRMAVVSESAAGLTPESHHWDEKLLILKDQYSVGLDYGEIINTAFEDGEGWTGSQILHNESASYKIEGIKNTVPSAGLPSVEMVVTGRGPMVHKAEVYAGARLLSTLNFNSYGSYKLTQALDWSDITSGGDVTITVKVLGVNGQSDRISVGYIKLRYPQATNMESSSEKVFQLASGTADKSYLEITNPASNTRVYDVTDRNSVRRVPAASSSTLQAVVTTAGTSRKLLATNTFLSTSIRRVNFRPLTPGAQDYVIITHSVLQKPAGGYTDPVKAYAEYRASEQGGSFDTLIVTTDQLYNQFSYGEKTSLAIYRLMKFLATAKLPAYLFLIGKGLDVNTGYYRNPAAFPLYKDLVPTAGDPGSDMAFTAGLGGVLYAPGVATGRLTATGPQDVANYFNKVKEMEARPFDDLRRKNILHLSGGINADEPQLFRSFLEGFGAIAKGYKLGAQVKSIAKQSVDIEVVNVSEELNKGLGLITFFGHSSVDASDFDIGYVTDPVMGYNNKYKYPFIVMNGCLAGTVFLNTTVFAENWINTSSKGALGFIAHSSYGFPYLLQQYSSLLYQVGFADSLFVSKGIGEVQKEVAIRYLKKYGASASSITQVQQMVLLGDPAVRLFGASKPDYEINEGNVSIRSFDGGQVTALTDSFRLSFVVRNFGVAMNRNYKITVTRTLHDRSTVQYDTLIKGTLYSDTLHFTIRKIKEGFGNNEFAIRIDDGNAVDELNEENNTVSVTKFIPLNGTRNLYPADFAIVHTSQLNLSFQYTDPLSDEREFMLELDTAADFTSAFKKQFTVKGTVLVTQPVSLLQQDTTAYYWRTKLASPTENESMLWETATFTFIDKGPEGWAQVRFPQFDRDEFTGLVKDPVIRGIKFQENKSDIAIRTFGALHSKPRDSVSIKINQAEYNIYAEGLGSFVCRNNTINLIAFDKRTTQAYPGIYLTWAEILYQYGSRPLICGREPYVINSFAAEELAAGNADLIRYVNNVALGDSVILFSMGDAHYSAWPDAAKNKLAELGIAVSQINALQAGEPVVIFARKGAPAGTAKVMRAPSGTPSSEELKVSGTIAGGFTSGAIGSPLIGPARRWDKFFTTYSETGSTSEVSFDILGVSLEGEQVALKTGIHGDVSLADVDTHSYPYLKIIFRTADPVFLSSAQLHQWIVSYESVAEGLILYRGSKAAETLYEGQTWDGNFSFVNFSDKSFGDSLTVRYSVSNPQAFASKSQTLKINAPAPGDTTKFAVPVKTPGLGGWNTLEVFVNPKLVAEQQYDNNVVTLNDHLNVLTDEVDPVLDVLFDDRHIQNEDFVSPSPNIRVTVWDNNPYFLQQDTTRLSLLLAYPCEDEECVFKPVYFSRGDISWKAETDSSEFTVWFNPKNLEDGLYSLRVKAADASGNLSGAVPYEIRFQIKNETSVLIESPYPNPFRYTTNFQFTITGNETPSALQLKILSLQGSTVHEFTEKDVAGFGIGRNVLTWEAVHGEIPLPNGIYPFTLAVVVKDKTYMQTGKVILIR